MKNFVGILAALACTWVASTAFAGDAKPITIAWSVDVDQRLPNAPMALSVPAVLQKDGQSWIVLGGRDKWLHVYGMDGSDIRRVRLQAASDSGSLALHNGLVVLADTAGLLYAVDPIKGSIVWTVQLTSGLTSMPVALGDDFLLQTTDNRIYRFSQDGQKKWSYSGRNNTLSMYINASPIVDEGVIYTLLNNGDAVALKAGSGDLIWKQQLLLSNDYAALSDLKAPLDSPLTLSRLYLDGEHVDNALLIPFFQGDFTVLSKKDGVQRLSLPVSLKSKPVVVENILYMADSEGFIHAYDITKNKRLWSKKVVSSSLLGLTLWQGSLWVADSQGIVYQLGMHGDVQSSVQLDGGIARSPVPTAKGLLWRTNRGEMALVQ